MTSSVDADCNLGLSLKIFHAPAPNFNDNHGTFCLLSQCLGCSFSAHPSHPYARCDFLADLIHATNRSAKAKFRGPGSGLIFASSHPVFLYPRCMACDFDAASFRVEAFVAIFTTGRFSLEAANARRISNRNFESKKALHS
ncbi:hypothetical protein HBI56_192290 [Parastagonospora nodorum]|uniref:Uncharacterized protein n=1 Tax=Phaeosphaeria nodorum (strain SN15 / ATCC MYA-4574 / FGSC 10173) TaxID=321614 RepID=A0A7U2IA82_PHANO|nr:hypothetical protein HBH56_178040 [Parastagonospora nodorum]QRD06123.1 hypothetical protein JI435_146930 [Parastagonospora nodorum SN15]KAH3931759.1 hypothetical protein HBH54_091770 [Parastagonospora nodorum]KAH3939572.1 hypothetical protein HBH53_232650 [Parastagonospora nodorum]KAH3957514.1 hypothetical protein HBH51_224600 [Parastagonospora nodorum]